MHKHFTAQAAAALLAPLLLALALAPAPAAACSSFMFHCSDSSPAISGHTFDKVGFAP